MEARNFIRQSYGPGTSLPDPYVTVDNLTVQARVSWNFALAKIGLTQIFPRYVCLDRTPKYFRVSKSERVG